MSGGLAGFLGIDCGTGSTKAVLIAAGDGRVLAVGSAPHRLDARADGTSEQDPQEWLTAARSAVGEAMAAAGSPEVRGIGVSGQQHGLVALDRADRPIRPAKLWNDTSTVEECGILTDAVGGLDAALKLTGNRFLPSYTAPKILWLRRHEPERYAAMRRACLPHDYLNLWLTGTFATEPGDASGTAYFDVRERAWSDGVLRAIDAERDWHATLPALVASRSVIGRLRSAVAAELGGSADVPVAAGGGDNMCAAIGVGIVRAGPVVVSLGTSGTAFGFRDRPAVDALGEVSAFCDSTGAWLPLACTLNCTGVVDWARDLAGASVPTVDEALGQSPPGARGLTFLPYLSGERTPDLPRAAGTLTGLRLEHAPTDIVRAAVEGVTDALVVALSALERTGVQADRLLAVGGGARSSAWLQLLADLAGLPVERPSSVEAAAEGAARQARWVVDGIAPEMTPAAATWQPAPHPELAAVRERLAALRDAAAREAAA